MIVGAVIGTLVLIVVFAWIGAKFRKITTSADFLLMGRQMPFWLFLGAYIGGMLGGSSVMGNTGLGFGMGLSAFWFLFPAFIFGIFFIFLFMRRLNIFGRKTGSFTLADFVAARYGRSSQIPAFILSYMRPGFITGLQFVGLAVVIQVLFGIPMTWGILIGAAVVLLFTITGGQYSALSVQWLQAVFQSLALLLILIVGTTFIGGFQPAISLVYAEMPRLFTNFFNIPPSLLTIYVISMGLFYLVDPWLYQWAYMAKDPKTASNVVLVGFGIPAFSVVPFTMGMFITAAATSGMLTLPEGMAAQNAYLWFTTTQAGPVVGAFILIGLLMTILSCASSFLMGGATLINNDLYTKFINRNATEAQKLRFARISVGITIVFGVVCALWLPILVPLWLLGQALAVSGLLAPILAAWFWKRATAKAAWTSMVAGLVGSFTWAMLAWINTGSPGNLWNGLHAAHIGVTLSVPLMIIVSLLTKQDCSPEMIKATSWRELSPPKEEIISREPFINWVGEKKAALRPVWYLIALTFILFVVSLLISPGVAVLGPLVYFGFIGSAILLVLFTIFGGRDVWEQIKFAGRK